MSWSGFARPDLFDVKYLLSCDFWCWEAFVAKAKACLLYTSLTEAGFAARVESPDVPALPLIASC